MKSNIFEGFERLDFVRTAAKNPPVKKGTSIFIGVSAVSNVTVSIGAAKVLDVHKNGKLKRNVEVLYNKDSKKLIITPAFEKNSNATVEFYPKSGFARLAGAPFYHVLKEIANIKDKAFRIPGTVARDGKTIIFDMSKIEIYQRNK